MRKIRMCFLESFGKANAVNILHTVNYFVWWIFHEVETFRTFEWRLNIGIHSLERWNLCSNRIWFMNFRLILLAEVFNSCIIQLWFRRKSNANTNKQCVTLNWWINIWILHFEYRWAVEWLLFVRLKLIACFIDICLCLYWCLCLFIYFSLFFQLSLSKSTV